MSNAVQDFIHNRNANVSLPPQRAFGMFAGIFKDLPLFMLSRKLLIQQAF